MSKIVFNNITIKNFKGIANYEMDFDQKKQEIVSETGCGKSSIFEAIKWCLGFDVSNFEPKIETYRIKNLSTKVELSITKDNLNYVLSRTSEQKWKIVDKLTGKKAFDTNKSTFVFDSLECKAKDYTQKVLELFGLTQEELNILLDIRNFNVNVASKWTWVDRRKFLKEKMNIDTLLKPLIEKEEYNLLKEDLLKGKDEIDIQKQLVQDKKVIANGDSKNKINGLSQYNTLIENKVSEITKLNQMDFDNLESRKLEIQKEIENLLSSKNKANKNVVLEQKNNELSKYRLDLTKMKNEFNQRLYDYDHEVTMLNTQKNGLIQDIKVYEKEKERFETLLEECNIDIFELGGEQLDETKKVCPMCNRELPQDKIEQLLFEFERQKEIRFIELSEKNEEYQEKINNLNCLIGKRYEELTKINNDYNSKLIEKPTYNNEKENELVGKINTLENEISNMKMTNVKDIVQEKLNELRMEQEQVLRQLTFKDLLSQYQNELQELKNAQRELANKETTRIKKQEQLKQYVKEEVEIINKETNKYFHKDIKFNFFIWNGAGAENEFDMCCNMLYKGVEYNNLSQGQKIICDTLFINSLQKLLDINFPIVVDNRQDNTFDIDTNSQLIELLTMKNKKLLGLTPINDIYNLEDCDIKEEK